MLDFQSWSRGSDLPGYADDDHEFPCSCIDINDHAEAIQCWGVNDVEAAQRRDAILIAVKMHGRLVAENARLTVRCEGYETARRDEDALRGQLVAGLQVTTNDLAVQIEKEGKDPASDSRIRIARAAIAKATAP